MEIINQYVVGAISLFCFCWGYIIKNCMPNISNKYIPLIMGILGMTINVWYNMSFTPDIVLAGLISGLASTGAFETVKNLKGKDNAK